MYPASYYFNAQAEAYNIQNETPIGNLGSHAPRGPRCGGDSNRLSHIGAIRLGLLRSAYC